MALVSQSSRAQDRVLGTWYQQIDQGQIKLPRFQRYEAWDRSRITGFLNTIIHNLPVGITLVLEVAGQEKFQSRFISTAERSNIGPITQHLLDGQQRLTAFWRAMQNNYEDETYFIYVPRFDKSKTHNEPVGEVSAYCQPRWVRGDNLRSPLWADDPHGSFIRGLIPTFLLQPGDIGKSIDAWIEKAILPYEPTKDEVDAFEKLKNHTALKDTIKTEIHVLRERIAYYNLPFITLPSSTEKDTALQVFINLNTNSKPLSLYDLIVAEIEEVSGSSLHQLQIDLENKHPNISRYYELPYLILTTSALLQDATPNNRGMSDMDKSVMIKNWPTLEKCLTRMALFLESQGIYDEARLPTNAVLAVTAACYAEIPDMGDLVGKAENLLKRYIWSSFFSDRYENSAASRAYSDYKALKSLLKNPAFTIDDLNSVPVLNREEHPLPTADALLKAKWPKNQGIQARAILAVTMKLGAVDFADGRQASYQDIQNREYHHVFPDSLLQDANISSYLALNCALITWKTNRIIGRKDPLEYLKERIEWVDEKTIRERLRTHLISYDWFARAVYKDLEGEELIKKLKPDFEQFLHYRATAIYQAMLHLVLGENISLDSIMPKSN